MRKKRLPFLIIGIIIISVFILMALFPSLFTSYDRKMSFGPWIVPNSSHILGTNSLGYDIFTELVYGTRETLIIGVASSVLALLLGIIVGYFASLKGFVGAIFDFIINSFVLFPRLIIMIVLLAYVENSTINIIMIIAFFSFVGVARVVRAKIIKVKSSTYMEALSLYGFSKWHLAIKHVIPNIKDVVLSKFLTGITTAIMLESTLSFIGFGNLYYPTWGVMINFARSRGAILMGFYSYLLVPSLCITLLSLSFYFISIYFEEKQTSIKEF